MAEEKRAGVGEQVSHRELLTNKSPNGSKHYSAEIQGHSPPKSMYKEVPRTSWEGLGETQAKSQRHGKKHAPEATSRMGTDGSRRVSGSTEQGKSR